MAHGFRSSQPYLNIAVAGAVIGAVIAAPRWGWVGAILGAVAGVAGAATIILVLVLVTWLGMRLFRRRPE